MSKYILSLLLLCTTGFALAQTEILTPRPLTFSVAKPPKGASPVSVNAAGLFAMSVNEQAKLTLPNELPLIVTHDRVEKHPSGNQTWIGYLRDFGKDYRVIITTGDSGSFGRIVLPNGEYWIVTEEGQTWAQHPYEAGLSQRPNLVSDGIIPSQPPVPDRQSPNNVPIGEATPSPQSTVDVMIVYTPSLSTQLGSGLQARLDQLISISNQAYIDSEVAITLRLVHSAPVSYSDSSNNDTALYELSGTNGSSSVPIPASLSSVATLRDTYGADLVVLMRAFNHLTQTSCGVGWIGGYNSGSLNGWSGLGYSVVSNGTSSPYYCDDLTFPHELGHNMGNMHDHRTTSDASGVFNYSFGHGIDNSFVSVMAYPSSFTNAPRIGKFSNPALTCNGQACGVNNSADNARSMNAIRDQVAAYRTAAKTSQTITFGAAPTGIYPGGTGTVSATASSGLPVTFSSKTTGICTVLGSTVTGVSAGTCTVAGNQAGDGSYSAAPEVTQSFAVAIQPPTPPRNLVAQPGPGRVTITFDPPTSNGGAAISGYTATCSAAGQLTRTATGSSSPLVVTELTGGVTYSCTVTASNGTGSSNSATPVTLTPKSATGITPILMLLLD